MIKVVAAGIPRSGSTWLFNAARIILQTKYDDVYSAWIDDFDTEIQVSACIVKTHAFDVRLTSAGEIILCSHRDLRDIATSLISMGWADHNQVLGYVRSIRELHDFWLPHSKLDLAYEDIALHSLDAVSAIAKALNVELTDCQKTIVLSSIPKHSAVQYHRGHDPVSLLHPGHITDGRPGRWKGQLPSSLAGKIWLEHSYWLALRGYLQD